MSRVGLVMRILWLAKMRIEVTIYECNIYIYDMIILLLAKTVLEAAYIYIYIIYTAMFF